MAVSELPTDREGASTLADPDISCDPRQRCRARDQCLGTRPGILGAEIAGAIHHHHHHHHHGIRQDNGGLRLRKLDNNGGPSGGRSATDRPPRHRLRCSVPAVAGSAAVRGCRMSKLIRRDGSGRRACARQPISPMPLSSLHPRTASRLGAFCIHGHSTIWSSNSTALEIYERPCSGHHRHPRRSGSIAALE